MRCPACGAELEPAARFCGGCGAVVGATATGTSCAQCGATLDAGAQFCGGCGTAVAAPGQQATIVAPASWGAAAATDRPRRPGGELARRPLHFIWIADCSGSMAVDGKIQALNTAIREAIPHMQQVAADNPNAQVLVRAVRFSDGAFWHIGQPTPVESFRWLDLQANGTTDMGRALTLVTQELRVPPMSERALPPVLVLVSDGQPTDDFAAGLKQLMAQPWGVKAVRIAIAIGEDADRETLQEFMGDTGLAPLQANNPEALVNNIRWVSTAVLQSASSPATQRAGDVGMLPNVPLALPATVLATPRANDVW